MSAISLCAKSRILQLWIAHVNSLSMCCSNCQNATGYVEEEISLETLFDLLEDYRGGKLVTKMGTKTEEQ